MNSILIESQGRVNDFSNIFHPEIISQHQKKIQFAIEIALYALFGSFIFVMIMLPTVEIEIQNMFSNYRLTDPVGTMIWIKMTLFMLSLIPLFSSLHLSSKRLKGRLFLRRKINH